MIKQSQSKVYSSNQENIIAKMKLSNQNLK